MFLLNVIQQKHDCKYTKKIYHGINDCITRVKYTKWYNPAFITNSVNHLHTPTAHVQSKYHINNIKKSLMSYYLV